MYAHLLIDNLLQMPTDQCQGIVEALRGLVDDCSKSCNIDGNVIVLWDGATCNKGLYDEDAARCLLGTLEGLCGIE